MRRRQGHTLAELLVALPLGVLLLALLLTTVIAQARLARGLADRMGRTETERLTFAVLRHELRWIGAGDVRAAAADSVVLRLLRGLGVSCMEPDDEVAVAWQGLRQPNADKDSLIVVHDAGESTLALDAAASDAGPCPGATQRLRSSAVARRGVHLAFETGTYHLRDRALRFRSGGEGRQPLTEEWLDDRDTGLTLDAGVPSGVVLAVRGAPIRGWAWALPNLVLP